MKLHALIGNKCIAAGGKLHPIMLKCPRCGHTGSKQKPHTYSDRHADTPHNREKLIAGGYNPELTSAAWFECGRCHKLAPWWVISANDPYDDFSGVNLIYEDGRRWDFEGIIVAEPE